MDRPHRNPFRHWASGLSTEVAVFAGLLLVLSGLCLIAGLLVR